MLGVLDNLYFYRVMNEQANIYTSLSSLAPVRPFAPRRRP